MMPTPVESALSIAMTALAMSEWNQDEMICALTNISRLLAAERALKELDSTQIKQLERGVDIGFKTAQLNQQEEQIRWWFDEREAKVIDELATKKDISRQAVLRQALRTYQLVAEGMFDLVEKNPQPKWKEIPCTCRNFQGDHEEDCYWGAENE